MGRTAQSTSHAEPNGDLVGCFRSREKPKAMHGIWSSLARTDQNQLLVRLFIPDKLCNDLSVFLDRSCFKNWNRVYFETRRFKRLPDFTEIPFCLGLRFVEKA